jgi:hypothetical protein
MRGRSTIAALALIAVAPASVGNASAASSSRDVAATHAYLVADHAILHTAVSNWSAVEASIAKLDARYRGECFHVGMGSPQSEEEQKLSLEVAGALWSVGYRTNASAVRRFLASVGHLSWSNGAIDRSARALIKSLREMITLATPDLCTDVHTWAAGGYKAVPTDVDSYAKHVEAIEINQIPRRLLAPYLHGADVALAAGDERLNRRFEELEFVHGQDQWNRLLEVLALNQ